MGEKTAFNDCAWLDSARFSIFHNLLKLALERLHNMSWFLAKLALSSHSFEGTDLVKAPARIQRKSRDRMPAFRRLRPPMILYSLWDWRFPTTLK